MNHRQFTFDRGNFERLERHKDVKKMAVVRVHAADFSRCVAMLVAVVNASPHDRVAIARAAQRATSSYESVREIAAALGIDTDTHQAMKSVRDSIERVHALSTDGMPDVAPTI